MCSLEAIGTVDWDGLKVGWKEAKEKDGGRDRDEKTEEAQN